MQVDQLAIAGAHLFTPRQFSDGRGVFLEAFKADVVSEVIGHEFDLRQSNLSVSAAGVVRGIHFADIPPGQAKYVTCVRGAIVDVVVDIRTGSPTFGQYEAVELNDENKKSLYLAEGLGHAFLSLADDSTVMYLCSAGYAPEREHGIHPLDDDIAIDWPTVGRDGQPLTVQLSEKDSAAPTLRQAHDAGLLPSFDAATSYARALADPVWASTVPETGAETSD